MPDGPAGHQSIDFLDGWEFADLPYYPPEMTALAYRCGVNYPVYSMTH